PRFFFWLLIPVLIMPWFVPVVVTRTLKGFHSAAQGRAAHPGTNLAQRGRTLKGFYNRRHQVVEPFQGSTETMFRYPGCAARPWAAEYNPFGVVRALQLTLGHVISGANGL